MRFSGIAGPLLYLGIGLAVQVAGYGDVTPRDLVLGLEPISTYAHILAWPLFVLLWLGYWFLMLILLFCVAAGLTAVYMWADNARAIRKVRKEWER